MNNQIRLIEQVNDLCDKHGLKKKYISDKCIIKEHVFSKFLHGKAELSPVQVERVQSFIDCYIAKHEGNTLSPTTMTHFQIATRNEQIQKAKEKAVKIRQIITK